MDHKISRKPLGEIVANEIRKRIWSQALPFGARLIESDLSEQFDVSRSTIRDAFKILEFEELVVNKTRKGTYVSEFSWQDWNELNELRIIIETFAFVKVAGTLTSTHKQELMSILKDMQTYATQSDWQQLFNMDLKLHSYIVNLSNNTRIIKIYDSIQVQIRTFLIRLDKYYSSPNTFYKEQKELLDTLFTKDTEAIKAKVYEHITYADKTRIVNQEMNRHTIVSDR